MRLGLNLGLSNTSPRSDPVTEYLFLDGGCLRARVRSFSDSYCDGEELQINWWPPSRGFTKVFYYDALPCQRPNQPHEDFQTELASFEALHAKLATFDRFRVNEGDTRYRRGRGREQKKVDVMIAVDMMIHTIRRNMSKATLLAGDADFAPLLNALSNEGMFVTLVHPASASTDLLAAADARKLITARVLYDWLEVPSQALLGPFPTVSRNSSYDDQNCNLIWSDSEPETGTAIWHQQLNDTVRVTSRIVGTDGWLVFHDGNWKNTSLLAAEDHSLILPSELPTGYAGL
jgi:uncharacterized LabA/DUF88 family protein